MTDTATAETLTARQQQVLAFVRASTADHGYPPSIREIADAVGLSSNSSIVHQLRALENKGLLRRNGNSPRALTLTDATERACSLDPETVADEFGIKGLAIDNGTPTLTVAPTSEQARELVLAMSLACGRILDDDAAQNYIEFEVSPANRPGYVVHVRRAVGPSPHTLRKEAEDRTARLEASLPELLGKAWDDGNAAGLDGWTGPGRGAGDVDPEAVYQRDRCIRTLLEENRRA